MIAGLFATVLKLGYTGILAADLGINITALANEGAGIYREIPDRRKALEQIQAEFKGRQEKFDGELVEVQSLSKTLNTSITVNDHLYRDLSGAFEALTTLKDTFDRAGLLELRGDTNPNKELTTAQKKAVNYILPLAQTGFSLYSLGDYLKSLSKGTTRVDEMVRYMNEIRDWNRLTPEQRRLLTATNGVKNPRLVSGYKLMKSALKYSGMAAISVIGITYRASQEKEELDDLNAAIAGVQKYIQVLDGEIVPEPNDFNEDFSPDSNELIYSFPRLHDYRDKLKSFDVDDFESFKTVINFFQDVLDRVGKEELEAWKKSFSTINEEGDLYDGLFNIAYNPAFLSVGMGMDSNCFTHPDWMNSDGPLAPYPYQAKDMRCVQESMRKFFAKVGVNVLRLAIDMSPSVPSSPVLTDKKREDIVSVCKNRVYKNLKPDSIRALIKRTKFVTDEEIDQVLRENLNGQCPFPS